MEPLHDESIMKIGREYRGQHLRKIPDKYLIWFWGQNKTWYRINKAKTDPPKTFKFQFMEYIEDSLDIE